MPATNDVLVVMAKYPRPGSVKTRLGERIGLERACQLYRAFLVDIASRFACGNWQLVWAVDPPGADLHAMVGPTAVCVDQQGDDLGQRMLHCFQTLFARGARRVVMIGADAPHLPDSTVRAAFAALGQYDVTVVPTRDGGYCLIGLRAAHDLFSGIPMGTAAVSRETRRRAHALHLSIHAVEPTFDIDQPADVKALERLIRSGSVTLAATAAVLASWRERSERLRNRG